MSWREISILYRHELRSALRERSIVVNSIVMPIFLYPLLLWTMFSGAALVQGLSERVTSRIAVYGLPAEHTALGDSIAALSSVEVAHDAPATPVEAAEAVRSERIDAAVVVQPATGEAAALEGNFVAWITYDQSEERSRRAKDRISGLIERYRAAWLEREGAALEIPPDDLAQFQIESTNVSSRGAMGASVLSLILPVFLVIMVALGCFYPAIDSTAGERERSTWETLMTVSASRTSVVTAKYLYVATLGITAGILNVLAMALTIGAVMAPSGREGAEQIQVSFSALAIVIMILGAVVLALLFAALMMILAAFARTFKDGQAMIGPVYYLALLPLFFVAEPDVGLDLQMAAVPVANVVLMIREAIQGSFQWLYIAETLGIVLIMVTLSLSLARYILGFEELLLGSYDGNLWRFIKERGLKRRGRTPSIEQAPDLPPGDGKK